KRRLAAQVLAVGDVDHLLGDDAGAGIFELRQRRFPSPRFNGESVRVRGRNWRCDLQLPLTPALSPQAGRGRNPAERLRLVREVAGERLAGDIAVVFRLHLAAVVLLDAATLADPGLANARQALLDVDCRIRIRVWSGGIINPERRLLRVGQRDLAEGHAQVRMTGWAVVNLRTGIDRPGGDLRHHQLALARDLVHLIAPGWAQVVPLTTRMKSLIARKSGCVGEGDWRAC